MVGGLIRPGREAQSIHAPPVVHVAGPASLASSAPGVGCAALVEQLGLDCFGIVGVLLLAVGQVSLVEAVGPIIYACLGSEDISASQCCSHPLVEN